MAEAEFYIFPVEDTDFKPDTIPKCYLLFKRLGELTMDLIEEQPELAKATVWVVWET